jgi:hypothetical protein
MARMQAANDMLQVHHIGLLLGYICSRSADPFSSARPAAHASRSGVAGEDR